MNCPKRSIGRLLCLLGVISLLVANPGLAQKKQPRKEVELNFPPSLPDNRTVVSDRSPKFLEAPEGLKDGVAIAETPPTVDFLYYPGQTYEGKPWSNWGDGFATEGKYYSAFGDHLAVGGKNSSHRTGNAYVYEYDAVNKSLRKLVDLAELLPVEEGHYRPGKIHSRLDLGRDGWIYFATHRGSSRATVDQYRYRGDWIVRVDPKSAKAEVVAHAPVPKHAIPCSVLDPERLIFYGGTAAGMDAADQNIQFFAYDARNRKLLYSGPDGPARYLIFARSTGRVYYVPGKDEGMLMRFDPETDRAPQPVPKTRIGVRAATEETSDGQVYTVGLGQRSADAALYAFDTETEETRRIGMAAVGSEAYVASLDVDPTGRYLYYVPGAHGGSPKDGTAVVQFDVQTGRKKVIAFLEPFYTEKYGLTLKGTYSTAVDPAGDKLYVTWNVSRGSRAWDSCGLTTIHIPESER